MRVPTRAGVDTRGDVREAATGVCGLAADLSRARPQRMETVASSEREVRRAIEEGLYPGRDGAAREVRCVVEAYARPRP